MAQPARVMVLAPMTSELKPLLRYTRARPNDRDGRRFYTARVAEVQVVMTQLGVGPEVACTVTEQALRLFAVDHVVVTGIAGGLDPHLGVGSVVVPETVLDLASGETFTAARLGGMSRAGTVGVADHLITDPDDLEKLRAEGVDALEMESSGVARACEAAGVPWSTVRAIGDRPDEGLTDSTVMSFLRPDGSADAGAAVRYMIGHPGRIPGLVRLARDSSEAAAKAARVTLRALGWQQ